MTVANAPQHAGAVDDSRRGRILRRALLTVCVLVLVLGVTVYCHARETEAPDCSQWEIIFDGYGEASCSEGLLRLKPTSADSQDKTHAGLATSTTVEIEAGGVQTIHTTMTTVRQLREDGEPNRLGGRLAPVELHRQQPLLRPGPQAQRLGSLQAGHRLPGVPAIPVIGQHARLPTREEPRRHRHH